MTFAASVRVLTNKATGKQVVVGFCRRHSSLQASIDEVVYNSRRGRTTVFKEPSVFRSRFRDDGSLEYIHIDD